MTLQDKLQKSKETSLNDLYEIAEKNDITIVSAKCPKCKMISLLSPQGECYIGIDNKAIQNEKEERQYLAHDIGHCVRGAFYNPYSPFSLIEQQEYRADKQAVNYLVPKEKLQEAMIDGNTEIWQLCEYFDVDVKYIKLAFWEYFDKII